MSSIVEGAFDGAHANPVQVPRGRVAHRHWVDAAATPLLYALALTSRGRSERPKRVFPMSLDPALLDAFTRGYAAHLPTDTRAIVAALEAALATGRAAWPGVPLDGAVFAAHLGERVTIEDDVVRVVEEVRAADLFIACACVTGAEGAATAFGSRYGHLVENALRRLDATHNVEDARQIVLERLLLPRGERPPALALYSGQGPLEAYLRVSVTREVFKLLQKSKREAPRDTQLLERIAHDDDPETRALKERYSEPFKRAFHDALAELDARERSVLRYHYVERLTTRQIGVVFGAHSSTVTRQLAQIRARLLAATRKRLAEGLGVDRAELESIVRLVESQLDLSLTRVLATRAPDGS